MGPLVDAVYTARAVVVLVLGLVLVVAVLAVADDITVAVLDMAVAMLVQVNRSEVYMNVMTQVPTI